MTTGGVIQPGPGALAARVACEEVFVRFHRLIDAGTATQAIDLFTTDSVFEVRGQLFEGRQAIFEFLQRREQQSDRLTRHLASNFAFELTSETVAQGSAQLLIVAASASEPRELELEAVSDCAVRFRRSESGIWRMTARSHRRFATARSSALPNQ